MSSQGSVIARVYTSDAYLPLQSVPVVFSQPLADGGSKLLAIRLTNSSGLTEPVFVETPELSDSLLPGSPLRPYAVVDIRTGAPQYNAITVEGVQIFPGVETIQGLQLRPIGPGEEGETVTIPGSNQNL